jgi:TPR repeat protein
MRILHIVTASLICAFAVSAQTIPTKYCKELVTLSNSSNPEAQTNLGICYLDGVGVEQDYVKAAELFSLAAEQGYAEAQCRLGQCYLERQGVRRNLSKGFELFQQAAAQNYGKAEYLIGNCYYTATAVNQDFVEAEKWAQRAVNHGYQEAYNLLALCKSANGGQTSDVKTELFSGAESGDASAQFSLGMWYLDRYTGERNLKEAEHWLLKSAEQGTAGAPLQLGHLYQGDYGDEIEIDYDKAIYWYRKGADAGDWIAESCLYSLIDDRYISLLDKLRDSGALDDNNTLDTSKLMSVTDRLIHLDRLSDAVRLLKRKKYENSPIAMSILGEIYATRIPIDYELAAKYLVKSLELFNREHNDEEIDVMNVYSLLLHAYIHIDYLQAIYWGDMWLDEYYKNYVNDDEYTDLRVGAIYFKIGVCYNNLSYKSDNNNVGLYREKAYEHYLKSKELSVIDACNPLSVYYFSGRGTAKNYSKAVACAEMYLDEHPNEDAQIKGNLYNIIGWSCYKGDMTMARNYEKAFVTFKKNWEENQYYSKRPNLRDVVS